MTTLLYSTVIGSRLYGLSNSESDYDRFEVYGWGKFRPKQSISGESDVIRCSLDRFLLYCNKGVPQYLEAMFSRQATENLIPYITCAYRPDTASMLATYSRTIKSFWQAGMENDDFKRRRHALRLQLNLRTAIEYGRFDPTLTDRQIEEINKMSEDKIIGPNI